MQKPWLQSPDVIQQLDFNIYDRHHITSKHTPNYQQVRNPLCQGVHLLLAPSAPLSSPNPVHKPATASPSKHIFRCAQQMLSSCIQPLLQLPAFMPASPCLGCAFNPSVPVSGTSSTSRHGCFGLPDCGSTGGDSWCSRTGSSMLHVNCRMI